MKYKPSHTLARMYYASVGGECPHCFEAVWLGDPVADVDNETFHLDCAQEVLDMEG